MPWKRVGKTVMVKKGGTWRKVKTHTSTLRAERHVRALHANAGDHEK